MAYNVAANLRQVRPGAAYLEGQDRVFRNALAERDMAGAEQAQRFSQENALIQRRRQEQADALAMQDRAREEQAAAQAGKQNKAKQLYTYMSHLAKAPSPEHFNYLADRMAGSELFREMEITREDLTPEEVQQYLPMFAAEAGEGPAVEAPQYEDIDGPRGAVLQRDPTTGKLIQVVGPDNSQPPAAGQNWRPLTPQEVAAAGLPPGTSAQTDGSGKIDVLSKRDATGGLSQKDQVTAKNKLTAVKLAKQQLAMIREKFETGRNGMNAFGGAQGWMPTQHGKAFDAAVDQMRSTLTALTRTPGVGAMSDYETKLDQSKFPKRTDYESVTAQKIQGIEDMLATIESGYTELLSAAPQQQAQQPPAQPAQGPVRVNTPAEAAALPSGTQFVTPDGQVRVKR